MTTRHLPVALLVPCIVSVLPAVAVEGVPPLPARDRVLVAESFRLAEVLGPRVWPGFDGRDAPVVLVDAHAEYLLNRREAPEGFAALPGETFRDRPVFARERTFPPNLLATFPAIGVETVVIGTPELTGKSPTTWSLTFAHELFHVFQDTHGLNGKILALAIGEPGDSEWHLSYPFPYEDPDVRRAMHLLGYALFRTATSPEDADPGDVAYDARVAREALDNLVTILSLESDDGTRDADYLRYQTAKEGVARYVEYRLAELAAGEGYRPSESFSALDGFVPYAEAWTDQYDPGQVFTIKHAGNVSLNRVEFYGLGLGVALALDRLGADWKEAYFAPEVWPDDLLAAALDDGDDRVSCPRRP